MSSVPSIDPPSASHGTVDIQPERNHPAALQVLSLLVFVLALVLFGGLALGLSGPSLFSLDPDRLLVSVVAAVAVLLALMLLHVALQAVVILIIGGRPRFSVGMLGKLMPYLTVTADQRFTRQEFATVTLVPSLVLALVAPVLVWCWPVLGAGVVVAIGLYLSGCVLGWWVLAEVLRQPEGCMLEDLGTGVRVYLP